MAIICIFGGRDFCLLPDKTYDVEAILNAYKWINVCVKELKQQDITIIDGVATGADTVGYRYALSANLNHQRFPAQWRVNGVYNPKAGFERNSEMLEVGTHFIGFWDGISGGTNDMRKKAITAGKRIRVFHYNPNNHLQVTYRPDWATL